MLPEELQKGIEKESEDVSFKELQLAREFLSEKYRTPHSRTYMQTKAERLSYLASRMPATFAVARRVLKEFISLNQTPIKKITDLGAGPGTVMWAASELFESRVEFHLIEADVDLIEIGRRLASNSNNQSVKQAKWELKNLEGIEEFPQTELTVFSYSFGEIAKDLRFSLIEKSWRASDYLLIIEPGTPEGFDRIHSARSQLIELGAHILAPCTHTLACPIFNKGWCHFAERIERSCLHKRLKEGTLGYEDEKYSYLIASKTKLPLARARIIGHPKKRSGHLLVPTCSIEGITEEVISKRTPELYKNAKKKKWGDSIDG